MKEFYICTECDWSIHFNMSFGPLDVTPPCPRCASVLEGFRILQERK